MGIGYGLAAALLFGTADFLTQWVARRIGSVRTQFYSQVIGLFALSVVFAVSGGWPADRPLAAWAWAVFAATLNAVATLAFYRALEIGDLSLVSPITASFGAVAALLSLLAGERLHSVTWLGILCAVVGVATASIPPATALGRIAPRGLGLAAWAALGYGMTFWVLAAHVTPALGPLAPVWMFRLIGLVLLLPLARPSRQTATLPSRALVGVLAVSSLNTLALIALMAGLRLGPTAVVSVMSSLFSAVTVLLAFLFLKERLGRHQWLGVAVILLGVALVNA